MTIQHRATAARLITDKGQSVTITHREAGAYDPATGTAAITTSTQAGKGVILPLAGYRKVGVGNIVAGDETLLLSALKADGSVLTRPDVGDTVTATDGTVYGLIAVDPLHPDGMDSLLDCVARAYQ